MPRDAHQGTTRAEHGCDLAAHPRPLSGVIASGSSEDLAKQESKADGCARKQSAATQRGACLIKRTHLAKIKQISCRCCPELALGGSLREKDWSGPDWGAK